MERPSVPHAEPRALRRFGWLGDAIRTFPPLSRAGLVVLAGGLAVDAAAHLASESGSLAAPCCGPGFFGHLVTVAGMVLTMLGILLMALRRPTRSKGPGERRL